MLLLFREKFDVLSSSKTSTLRLRVQTILIRGHCDPHSIGKWLCMQPSMNNLNIKSCLVESE